MESVLGIFGQKFERQTSSCFLLVYVYKKIYKKGKPVVALGAYRYHYVAMPLLLILILLLLLLLLLLLIIIIIIIITIVVVNLV